LLGKKLPTTWLVTLDAIVSVSFLALVGAPQIEKAEPIMILVVSSGSR
jgi:hypothetical protein